MSRENTTNTASILGASLMLVAVACVAVIVAPDRAQFVVAIQSTGASEVVLPIGYWAGVALWAWLAAHLIRVPVRQIAARAVVVGLALHVVLLLATFSPRLGNAALFTTPFYWTYGRLFCASVLASAVVWGASLTRNGHLTTALAPLDTPLVLGTVVFAAALARYDPVIAGIGLSVGCAGALARTRAAGGSLARHRQLLHRLVQDERVFLCAVFLLALGLRLLYLRRVMSDPNYLETGADSPVYDELAWSIARGEGVRASFTARFPLLLLGYVRFVSLVYAIAGHRYFVLGVVQGVIGSLACLLLYRVGKALFDVTTARVASTFAAISFPLVFAAAAIGHQAIDVVLTLLLVWVLVRLGNTGQRAWWLWAGTGVIFGTAIAVRETNAFFLVFVLFWIPFVWRRCHWTVASRAAIALLVGALIAVGPLLVPMVSTPERRLLLRQHFDRLYRGEFDAVRTRDGLIGPLEDPGAALAQLRSSPARVLRTLGRTYVTNFAMQFFSQPYGGFDLVFLAKGSRYCYGLWFYAYTFAVAGLVLAIGQVRAGAPQAAGIVLVLGLIASRTLPHVVLESAYRHRVPIEPFLILLAAAAAVRLFTSAGARRSTAARRDVIA